MRPWGWPEAVIAVPAAGVVIATGAISLDHAAAEAARLGPVIGFLAAVLVLALAPRVRENPRRRGADVGAGLPGWVGPFIGWPA